MVIEASVLSQLTMDVAAVDPLHCQSVLSDSNAPTARRDHGTSVVMYILPDEKGWRILVGRDSTDLQKIGCLVRKVRGSVVQVVLRVDARFQSRFGNARLGSHAEGRVCEGKRRGMTVLGSHTG